MRRPILKLIILISLLSPSEAFCNIIGDITDGAEDLYDKGKHAVEDAAKAFDDGVKKLVGDAKNLGSAVVTMGADDLKTLKDLYKGDIGKLWGDIQKDLTDVEDELAAAEKIGMDTFDLLSHDARDWLMDKFEELEREFILSQSTRKRDIKITSRESKPGTGIFLHSINKANIVAVGAFSTSIGVKYKGFGHTFKATIGDSSAEINYGVIKIKRGTPLQDVAIDQTIEKGNHHYYGVGANVGSVIYGRNLDRDIYLNLH